MQAWVQRLRERLGDDAVRLIETHASYVVLAGADAYKLKKAVDLGFLDFSTLARRRFFCDEELRLNRRTAPELYLAVRPLAGTAEAPELDGAGPPLDWVLHMRAFDDDGLWSRLAQRGAIDAAAVASLVDGMVALHAAAEVAAAPLGQAEAVRAPLVDCLDILERLAADGRERTELRALREWEQRSFAALRATFDARARDGFVRECHGDLHLGNIVQIAGRPRMFDCLEFSAELRFTDVMSDVAFVAMDLGAHRLPRLAARLVNAYAEAAADEAGLVVLGWYRVYRALVRAKVAALRAQQLRGAADAPFTVAALECRRYLDVALEAAAPPPPVLLLTHGLSGSGKTRLTQSLLEMLGAIRLRADVQRKRMFGLGPLDRSDAALKTRMYAPAANDATAERLRDLAGMLLRAGLPVILDATFLGAGDRAAALALADAIGVQAMIIDFQATPQTLRERVAARSRAGDDASEAGIEVLQAQLATAQPLRPDERDRVFVFDAEPLLDEAAMPGRWAPLLRRLGRDGPPRRAEPGLPG